MKECIWSRRINKTRRSMAPSIPRCCCRCCNISFTSYKEIYIHIYRVGASILPDEQSISIFASGGPHPQRLPPSIPRLSTRHWHEAFSSVSLSFPVCFCFVSRFRNQYTLFTKKTWLNVSFLSIQSIHIEVRWIHIVDLSGFLLPHDVPSYSE